MKNNSNAVSINDLLNTDIQKVKIIELLNNISSIEINSKVIYLDTNDDLNNLKMEDI